MTRDSAGDPSSSGALPIVSIAPLRRVLIVEDNDELRRRLVDYFTEKGWQVEAARTLHAAIAIATRQLPHVIITELILPDVRGYFATRYRNAVSGGVTIVAVTRLPSVLFDNARKAGFDDVLGKPVDFDALHERLELALSADGVRA